MAEYEKLKDLNAELYKKESEKYGEKEASRRMRERAKMIQEVSRRADLQERLQKELKKAEVFSELPPEVSSFFEDETKELQENIEELDRSLAISTEDLIKQKAANINVSGNMRYTQLVFLPLKDFPHTGIWDILGSNPNTSTNVITTNAIPWAYAPEVEIVDGSTAAPEFGLVDPLVMVTDNSGDGFGFEELSGVYSTSTSTFNDHYNFAGGPRIAVKLDMRIFSQNCYAGRRTYILTYASGHTETMYVMPPSPCWQSNTQITTVSGYGWSGNALRYCTNSDYLYQRDQSRPFGNSWGTADMAIIATNELSGNPTRFDWSAAGISPQMLISQNVGLAQWDAGTDQNGLHPTKADLAEYVYDAQSLSVQATMSSAGSVQWGSPLAVSPAQQTRADMFIFPLKQMLPPQAIVSSTYGATNNFPTVYNGYQLRNSLESHNGVQVFDASGVYPIRPAEGNYGVTRVYTYSENLGSCDTSPPTSIDVCLDKNSPSYYLTTSLDCNGTNIASYISGAQGAWIPVAGPAGCCSVDCTNFIMLATSTDASFGASDGTITIDFTNGTTGAIGNYNATANQHSYTVSLTDSSGATITQNGNSAYTIGASFTDATCDTTLNSSIVTCNSNASITVGMSVTGTGIAAGSFVGAITGGQPGAVTEFQLSSAAGTNVPVNSASAQTNTTLTFSIAPFIFQWGSLPANTGSNYYILTVTDDDGCIWTQNIPIRELSGITDCTIATAINYNSAAQVMCVPDCCLYCADDAPGVVINSTGNIVSGFFSSSTWTSQPTSDDSTSDGELTVTGGIHPSLTPYITSTMSYKYSLATVSSSGAAYSGSAILATTTSTVASGINATFTSLSYGYYTVLVEIEDSSTGADAGLEKCIFEIPVDVKAKVCPDQGATNYGTAVPTDLQVSAMYLCTYPAGCDCNITNILIVPGSSSQGVCLQDIAASYTCNPASATQIYWTDPNGNVVNLFNPTQSLASASGNSVFPGASISGVYTFHIIDGGAGGNCTTTADITYTAPICGCTDASALNYDATATLDDNSCLYPIPGCTDPVATNYDPNATVDDGSCLYPRGGCTDPTATNYDPLAVFDDGSCMWEGCLDQSALNYLHDCNGIYNPNINANNGGCCLYCTPPVVDPVVIQNATASSVTCANNADGMATFTCTAVSAGAFNWGVTVFDTSGTIVYSTTVSAAVGISVPTFANLAVGPYTWEVVDTNGCTVTGIFSIGSSPSNCGCTDPNASNYNPSATIDDGSCIYCGCTDPLASNYNPNAACDDGTCEYNIVQNPCQLNSSSKRKLDNKLFGCLTLKGAMYLNKLRIGYADDCSIMNQWKLILVNYLLQRDGLDCIYNCTDDMTTAPASATADCDSKWTTGGPATGLNDVAYPGSSITTGEGTTITNPGLFFVPSTVLFVGDVIKMPSGLIYEVVSGGSCTNGCYNPETTVGATSGHWAQCTKLNTFPNTTTVNYIDPFILYINEQCDKCTEDPQCIGNKVGKIRGGQS